MLESRKRSRRTVVRFLAFLVGGAIIGVLSQPRARRAADAPPVQSFDPVAQATPEPAPRAKRRRSFGARLALASVFSVIFVGGAALTALGGDELAQAVQGGSGDAALSATADDAAVDATAPDGSAPDASTPDAGAADPAATTEDATTSAAPAPADDPALAPLVDATAESAPAPATQASDDPASAPVLDAQTVGRPTHAATRKRARTKRASSDSPLAAPLVTLDARAAERRFRRELVARLAAKKVAADPEVTAPFTASVIWLNRSLPDPTPPSKRLQRSFGRMLVHTAKAHDADWSLVLGILRSEGATGRVPATQETVQTLAQRLAELKSEGREDWQAAADVTGDPSLADRAIALAHYDHAVGIETLISGLDKAEKRLTKKLLEDPNVIVYAGGRADLEANRVNVRVVSVIAYLRDTFGSVTVSSLIDGHRLYARPRVISAHVYGLAVDVAAVGGTSIVGNQEPGGMTEKAVRALLFLPPEDLPRQVISLLALGGPSFALADHYDHIHVGF